MTKEFTEMATLLNSQDGERFDIIKFELSEQQVDIEKAKRVYDADMYAEVRHLEPGQYVKLIDKEKHEIVMSDTWMEKETNKHVIENARGDILIAGLGIGMLLIPLQNNPLVTSITVVEKYDEIVKMITSQVTFNEKVKIVIGDIFTYVPDGKYDMIYFDIWNNICGDNYPEMMKLHLRYRKYLKTSSSFMDSWRRTKCRELHKEDKTIWRR